MWTAVKVGYLEELLICDSAAIVLVVPDKHLLENFIVALRDRATLGAPRLQKDRSDVDRQRLTPY